MKELAFYYFQCVNDRIQASADKIEMYIVENESEDKLELIIRDNGEKFDVGFMQEDNRAFLKDYPAFHFFQYDSRHFGGDMQMLSHSLSGNTIAISYPLKSDKRPLLGDVAAFLSMLFITHPKIHFIYSQISPKGEFLFNSELFITAMGKIDYNDRKFLVNLKSLMATESAAIRAYA